jgi:hypothetical protein
MFGLARPRLIAATLLIPVLITAAFLLVRSQASYANAPQAILTTHTCTPTGVGVFSNRIHVRCSTGGAPGAAITYFAFCTQNDSALSARYLSTMTAAKATGKNLVMFYDQNDLSGTNCGCGTGDCRVITGLEMQQ